MAQHLDRRDGLALIELLVVIAIIAILISMIFPATMAVRDQARRAACKKNLSGLGDALLRYHATYRHLPPGYADETFMKSQLKLDSWDSRSESPYQGNYYGWGAFILRELGADALYDSINWGQSFGLDQVNEDSIPVGSVTVRMFRCPAETTTYNETYFGGTQASERYATSSYVGCTGYNTWPAARNDPAHQIRWGLFGMNELVTLDQDCADGASNVIMLGERSGWPERTSQDALRHYSGAIWIGSFNKGNISHMPQDDVPDRYSNLGRTGNSDFVVNGVARSRSIASSQHLEGANVCMGDGSTHFLSENADNDILRLLSMRSDGTNFTVYDAAHDSN